MPHPPEDSTDLLRPRQRDDHNDRALVWV